jgi:hypothetical protein
MSDIPSAVEIITDFVTSGYSVHIEPHRLQNDWLGVEVIGFCVDVKNSSGEIVTNGVHASFREALSDAWLLMPGVLPDEEE